MDSHKEDLFKWKRIIGDAPKSRDSHTSISFLDQLLLFGGSSNSKSYSDLYKFSITNKIWTKLEPIADKGHEPSPREGHIATLVDGDKMLVHGGINDNQDCFNDAFILVGLHKEIDQAQSEIRFDEKGKISNQTELKIRQGKLQMLRWFKCEQQGDVPTARDSHSVAVVNSQIFMFGGQDLNENLLNDLYKVNLSQSLVKKVLTKSTGETIDFLDREFTLTWKHMSLNVTPDVPWPIKRSSHSMNVFEDRFLVLIGGETSNDDVLNGQAPKHKKQAPSGEQQHTSQEDSDMEPANKPLNDIWVYDVVLNKWKEITTTVKVQTSFNSKKMRKIFEPRMAHSSNVYEQYIVVFGGYNSQNNQYSPNNICILSLSGCTDFILSKPCTYRMMLAK